MRLRDRALLIVVTWLMLWLMLWGTRFFDVPLNSEKFIFHLFDCTAGFSERRSAWPLAGKSGATMMAAALVLAAAGVYFGLVRNVNCVGPASSTPAIPVISNSAGTFSAVAPIDLAISSSFILQIPAASSGPSIRKGLRHLP